MHYWNRISTDDLDKDFVVVATHGDQTPEPSVYSARGVAFPALGMPSCEYISGWISILARDILEVVTDSRPTRMAMEAGSRSIGISEELRKLWHYPGGRKSIAENSPWNG
jgi:hypothetical protein